MVMFLFLVAALVVVVAAVTLAVVGRGEDGPLPEAAPDALTHPLPGHRRVVAGDVEALRFPIVVRGYRMAEVDRALNRLGAEIAERDGRIARLEAALAGIRENGRPHLPDPSAHAAEHPGPAVAGGAYREVPGDPRPFARRLPEEDPFGPGTPPHGAHAAPPAPVPTWADRPGDVPRDQGGSCAAEDRGPGGEEQSGPVGGGQDETGTDEGGAAR
ncbi:DivIVA domain-containing protein [Streptomyces sp. LD120]|uniref:DivIVA domain-containing protein n=1 Tax=Streptomyces physcomitrii TaxID=2724184 RepID=A0ABX1GY01_9ACTN|nr:DivIVA domain-containing protein [Streptomyces physcomitrii]